VAEEHRKEMEGIASALNVTYEDALMANFFYELSDVTADLPPEWKNVSSRSCTGIVAQASDGTIYHGRNQDYPPPFSPLQYDGTFTKGGKVVFEGTSFAGTIGMGGTCMVPGKWSAEINARDDYKQPLQKAIESASKGDFCFPMLLRSACEHGGEFEDGMKYLSETPIIQGGYLTVAGAAPGEGAIVTRNASGTDTDILRLKDGYPADKPWFLIQTNYDHWKKAPIYDDRRDNGKYDMEQVGPGNLTLDTLWDVMSTSGGPHGPIGVYNPATIHTELIIPAKGEYHTYLRHNVIDPPPRIVV
jgi:N-acylethanolamine-hydrolysing acid amidase